MEHLSAYSRNLLIVLFGGLTILALYFWSLTILESYSDLVNRIAALKVEVPTLLTSMLSL